jgi:hypothetical protein
MAENLPAIWRLRAALPLCAMCQLPSVADGLEQAIQMQSAGITAWEALPKCGQVMPGVA